jgi:hypothetical protein
MIYGLIESLWSKDLKCDKKIFGIDPGRGQKDLKFDPLYSINFSEYFINVCVSERDRDSVCVCVRERERKRKRKRERECVCIIVIHS